MFGEVSCLAAAFNKKRGREERTPLISQHKIWKWHYKSKKHQDPEMFWFWFQTFIKSKIFCFKCLVPDETVSVWIFDIKQSNQLTATYKIRSSKTCKLKLAFQMHLKSYTMYKCTFLKELQFTFIYICYLMPLPISKLCSFVYVCRNWNVKFNVDGLLGN